MTYYIFYFCRDIMELLQNINGCIIIPTYNNEKTLKRVIEGVLRIVGEQSTVIVINDGCTDSSSEIIASFEDKIVVITNEKNQGKGYSLRRGLRKAIDMGYDHALTIDSDGQHFPEDMKILLEKANECPNSVIMGSRNMEQEGVPGKSSFGNRFSNFWFKLETMITLPDTQTGFRIYPLKPMRKMRFFTRKFEFEIEVIVRLAWKRVPFHAVPIQVKYDPDERVSHFRPGRDFFRISVLNSVLVLGALIYYYPKRFLSIDTLRIIRDEAIKPEESNFSKALSLGFGCFMGIVPIWGFQLLVGIPLSVLFKMNKVLFIAAANISIPPMIPLIIYASMVMGQLVTIGYVDHSALFNLSLDQLGDNLYQYVIGACLLAVTGFVIVFLLSFGLLKLVRKDPN